MGNQQANYTAVQPPTTPVVENVNYPQYMTRIQSDEVPDMSDIEDFEEFLNEEKESSPAKNPQRLWVRDSIIWSKQFNGKRVKFIKMTKLCKALKIKSVINLEKKDNIEFIVDAQLNINMKALAFVLSKSHDHESKDTEDGIEWQLSIKWKDINAPQILMESLTPKQPNKNVQNGTKKGKGVDTDGESKLQLETKQYIEEFKQFVLQWLSSHNVEQFRENCHPKTEDNENSVTQEHIDLSPINSQQTLRNKAHANAAAHGNDDHKLQTYAFPDTGKDAHDGKINIIYQ
eukprot:338551_1